MYEEITKKCRRFNGFGIKNIAYIRFMDKTKLVITADFPSADAVLHAGDEVIPDAFNDKEPYDRKTHVFYLPANIKEGDSLCLTFKRKRRIRKSFYVFSYSPVFADEEKLIEEYDSVITPVSKESRETSEGIVYTHLSCRDKNDAPVEVFVLEADMTKNRIYTGTPGDGLKCGKVKAKIPEEIASAVRNGVDVRAAVNADFFDMFGDCSPSGLCVKNGHVIANGESNRPFIAGLKDGRAVLTDFSESPDIKKDILNACGGLERIVKNGRIYDWAPLEPFSYVRHPRTAIGVTKEGNLVCIVADGRIPEYSNGATLYDMAKLLLMFGVSDGANFDGGGSSVCYTKEDGRFVLHNRPADLIRPRARLIRKEYDSLLIVSES